MLYTWPIFCRGSGSLSHQMKRFSLQQPRVVLADFIRENAIYDQVRFLDNDGMETVRINWGER